MRDYTPVMWLCECGVRCTDTEAHEEWHRQKEKKMVPSLVQKSVGNSTCSDYGDKVTTP